MVCEVRCMFVCMCLNCMIYLVLRSSNTSLILPLFLPPTPPPPPFSLMHTYMQGISLGAGSVRDKSLPLLSRYRSGDPS